MRKRRLALVCSAFLIFALVSAACNQIDRSQEVASVNDLKITVQEFEFYLSSVKSQMESEAKPEEVRRLWDTEEAMNTAKEKALEAVVMEKVQLIIAGDKGIILDENEQKEVVNQKKAFMDNVGGRDAYKKELGEMGLTDKGFTNLIQNYMLTEKLYRTVINESGRFNISEEQIQEYYQQKYADFESGPQARVKHILFKTVNDNLEPLPEEQQRKAKEQAEEVYARIKAGENFDVLMHQYSEDQGLEAYPEGYPVMQNGQMIPEFEKKAFELNEGEISDIVTTEYGYHIMKVEERFDHYPLEQVREWIRQVLMNEQYSQQIDDWQSQMSVKTNDDVLRKITLK